MRTMEFTIENIEAFRIGQTLEVTEGKLPTSYFFIQSNTRSA